MAKVQGIDEEDLGHLSKEELAALKAEPSESETYLANGGPGIANVDPGADPLAGTAKVEMEPDPDEEKEPKEEAKEAKAEEPKTPEKAAEKAAEKTEETDEDEAEEPTPFVVPLQAREIDPELVKAELAKAELVATDAIAAVMKKYNDGDLTQDEMLAEREKINDAKAERRFEIRSAVREADQAAKHETDTRIALWKREVDGFMGQHPAYKDPDLKAALDRKVKELAGDPANEDLSDRKILEKAHQVISSKLKVEAADPEKAKKDALEAVKQKRRPDLSKAPTTLSGLPAAAPQNADEDEFSGMDSLIAKASSGDAQAEADLERLVAGMSREQQERWARS
jgi:hypothetical protein